MSSRNKKTGLGRGISSLIPDLDLEGGKDASGFFMCPVDQIARNPYQPRIRFDQDELDKLAASIAEQGILQPLLVRTVNDSYELIAGERRLRAAKAVEKTHVPVIIKELTDEQVLEIAIIENIQRANLNVLEEADAYARLIQEFGYTQEKVALKIGKNRSTIANLLRLRALPDFVKEPLKEDQISMGHARALLVVPSEEEQKRLLGQILEKGLSVRQVENLVKKVKSTGTEQPSLLNLEEKDFIEKTSLLISEKIKSGVNIKMKGGKGTIELKFSSREECQRLADALTRIT